MKIETYQEASDTLLNLANTVGTESVALMNAYDRILAEDIVSQLAVPSFSRSAYDGYALRSIDTVTASEEHPVTLSVTEVVPAGYVPQFPITEGKAARVMTGAPIPEGATAVVMHEKTSFTDTDVTITFPIKDGNIVPAGEDVEKGTPLLKKGHPLSASDIALLAGQGMTEVVVYRQPSIGLISTGSELIETGNPLEYGKIYNTNQYLLSGYLRKSNVIPNILGIAEDNLEGLCDAVAKALETNDMVITTGGVSAGDFDYMSQVVERIGANLLFHRLRFKPGGAMLAAEKDGKLIICLSGNPGAAATSLLVVGFPCIRKLCGFENPELPQNVATLGADLNKKSPQTRLLKGRSQIQDGQLYFYPLDNQRNGSVSSMTDADLIAVIPGGADALTAGAKLDIYIIE